MPYTAAAVMKPLDYIVNTFFLSLSLCLVSFRDLPKYNIYISDLSCKHPNMFETHRKVKPCSNIF